MDGVSEFDKLVGSNVQTYRTAKGLSQSDLAAAMSEGGEHMHQQTIQKIEKGTRPLKYSEALRICRVLGISPEELTEGEAQAAINAEHLGARLIQIQGELHDFAKRLEPILVDLAKFLSLLDLQEFPAARELVKRAEGWIAKDWGESLNMSISLALRNDPLLGETLRNDPLLGEISPDYDALTYREILKRVVQSFRSGEPDGGTFPPYALGQEPTQRSYTLPV
jgi:transcriptional regulator with XRE-family HTH domain